MWLKAIATYEGGLAHYNMLRENEGIYQAMLEKYDGKPNHHPPKRVILIRGEKGWTGDIKDRSLIKQLGTVIDTRLKGRLYSEIENNNNLHHRTA